MKPTLQQIQKEAAEAFDIFSANLYLDSEGLVENNKAELARPSVHIKKFLAAQILTAIEKFVEATKVEERENDCGQNPDYSVDQCNPSCGFNHALKVVASTQKAFFEK